MSVVVYSVICISLFLLFNLIFQTKRLKNDRCYTGIFCNSIIKRKTMLRNRKRKVKESVTDENDDIRDVSKCNFEGDFDTQVDKLLLRVRLSRMEVENLQHLLNDLEDALRIRWRRCEVHPFGSIISGLGIKTSDVDCYVDVRQNGYKVYDKDPVILARNVIRQRYWIFDQIFAIATAKVPILKFYHIPTGCHCDVNFKSPSGVRNSMLIGYLINSDSRALHLAIIVKYWSVVYSITGTNKMPTYALIMMVIFYLQVIGILPSVKKLQDNVPSYIVDGWNTSFNTLYQHKQTNYDTLYELLGGFFQYYSRFNFRDDMIVPYLGYPLKKQQFSTDSNIPAEYEVYRYKVMNNECPPIKLEAKKICVQDPFDHSRNCGVAAFPTLVDKIMELIQYGARMYNEKPSAHFLKALLIREPIRDVVRQYFNGKTGKISKNTIKRAKRKLKNTLNNVTKAKEKVN